MANLYPVGLAQTRDAGGSFRVPMTTRPAPAAATARPMTAPPASATNWFSDNAPSAAPAAAPAPAADSSGLGSAAPQVSTGGGLYPLSSVSGEGLMRPFDTAFVAPTADQVRATPGYQFTMDEGQKAVERGAAAKGVLGTGGAAKALTRYAQGVADTNYDQAYNRAFNEYRTAYDIYNGNQSNQFNRLAALAGLGQTSANQLGQAGSSYANQAGQNITGSGNAQAAAGVAGANAWTGALSNIGQNALDIYNMNRGTSSYSNPNGWYA